MKISVLFGDYCPFHENKDPGQIPLGLMENGIDADVITITKPELKEYKPSFPVIQKSKKELCSDNFWSTVDSDAVIVYYLWLKYPSTLIEKIKKQGKKVILKFDSDGRIGYPLKRHEYRVPLKEHLNAANLVSYIFWRLPFKSMKRRKHATLAAEVIKQIELCDAAIIESPDALANLNYFLTSWNRSDLIKRTKFIPNPVTPDFISGEIVEKENLVVTHGRWEDYTVKNTSLMVKTAIDFLKQRQDYRFHIFGTGIDHVRKLLVDAPAAVNERIIVDSFVKHENVRGILNNAKILFIPSRWESFSLAAAEALCVGCSITGTPAEALRYQAMQGFSGSIAATFDREAILAALLQDAIKWDEGKYNSQKIAEFWRPKLDRKNVAKNIGKIVGSVQH